VHPLTVGLEHLGDGVLGQPVDLYVGVETAQLVGDGEVAAGVPQPDGRGEVEHPTGAAARPGPRGRRRVWGGGVKGPHEVVDEQVDPDRVAEEEAVATALDQHEGRLGQLGEPPADAVRAHPVVGPVDHEHRTPDLATGVLERLASHPVAAKASRRRVDQHLWIRGGRPGQPILTLLGRVRLGEHLAEEEVPEVVEVTFEPVVPVVLRPALGRVQPFLEAVVLSSWLGDLDTTGRRDRHDPRDALRVRGCGEHRPHRAAGQRDEHGPLGAGGVQDGDRVLSADVVGVGRRAEGAVGLAGAAAVIGQHPEVPGQVADLALPEP
jgi:hypothetical protein